MLLVVTQYRCAGNEGAAGRFYGIDDEVHDMGAKFVVHDVPGI